MSLKEKIDLFQSRLAIITFGLFQMLILIGQEPWKYPPLTGIQNANE